MSNISLLVPNEMEVHSKKLNISDLTAVAAPSNANAAIALVPVGGLYTGTADPHIVYVRTA